MKISRNTVKKGLKLKQFKKLILSAAMIATLLLGGNMVYADPLLYNTEDTAFNLTSTNNDAFINSTSLSGANDSDFYVVNNPQSTYIPYVYTFSLQSPVNANADMQIVIYNDNKQIIYLNKNVEDNGFSARDLTYFILNPGEKAYIRVHPHDSSYSSSYNYTLSYRRT